jgi:hypothetical protein
MKLERIQKSIYIDKWLIDSISQISRESGYTESSIYRKLLVEGVERKLREDKEWQFAIKKSLT